MTEKEQRLTEVEEAISTVLNGGQSYKIGDTSLTRASLSTLYEMKKELKSEINEESKGGTLGRGMAAVFFDRR